jgi:hypothetical protein
MRVERRCHPTLARLRPAVARTSAQHEERLISETRTLRRAAVAGVTRSSVSVPSY